MTARLFVICGLPGSGKTTLARQLETAHDAVRLCPDEWMTDLWDGPERFRIEAKLWDLGQRVLSLGVNVVIEFGSWTRAERDALRQGARRAGSAVELRYLDAPLAELARRVRSRDDGLGITRAHFEEWERLFEIPTEEECALFDPPVVS